MIVFQRPLPEKVEALIDQVCVEHVRSYMRAHGWQARPSKRPDTILFEGPLDDSGKPLRDHFPASEEFSDFGRCVEDLIRMLSTFEKRAPEDIIAEMLAGERAQPVSAVTDVSSSE
jgi:hypothetical protein